MTSHPSHHCGAQPTPAAPYSANFAVDQSVRFVVAALTRHGAYLQVGRADAALYSDRNGFVAPLANLTIEAFRALVDASWIELNSQGQWLLAKTGRDAVRRARSGLTVDDASESEPTGTNSPAVPGLELTDAPTVASTRSRQSRPTVEHESPLAWLHRRRDKLGRPLLSNHAFDAGERLRADFWFAAMTPRTTASWSPIGSDRNAQRSAPSNGLDMSENVIAARERVRHALAAVGPELCGILIDVCCHEKGIEHTERETGWPVRSGRIVLQLALERLARHYGFVPPGQTGSQIGSWTPEGRIRAWSSSDHRPTSPHQTTSI
jgi:Domain of unknown function (DUF6456)